MADKISPQQIEYLTELHHQNKLPVPKDLKQLSVSEALTLINSLRKSSVHPGNCNVGGYDVVPSFNY